MANSTVLFVGTPGAGKTTYLALLNLAITSKTKSSIRLGHFSDDREYLNRLAKQLFRCEVVERTEVDQTSGLRLSVVLADTTEILLNVPDLSGEVWKDLLLERRWEERLRDNTTEANGICIFVNVSLFTNDPTIAETDRAARAIGETANPIDGDRNAPFAKPGLQSSQVQLVDLLQIVSKQFGSPERHVSIILSAFDTVSGAPPRRWIELEAPLVHQYLSDEANSKAVRLFGVSAQGGDFGDETTRAGLLKIDPLTRAFIVDADGGDVDIDEPVLWALDAD